MFGVDNTGSCVGPAEWNRSSCCSSLQTIGLGSRAGSLRNINSKLGFILSNKSWDFITGSGRHEEDLFFFSFFLFSFCFCFLLQSYWNTLLTKIQKLILCQHTIFVVLTHQTTGYGIVVDKSVGSGSRVIDLPIAWFRDVTFLAKSGISYGIFVFGLSLWMWLEQFLYFYIWENMHWLGRPDVTVCGWQDVTMQ